MILNPQLDNHEIKPGKSLKINISVPNLRLFVGNIPKSKGKEEILDEFGKLTGNWNYKNKNKLECKHLKFANSKLFCHKIQKDKPKVKCNVTVSLHLIFGENNEEIV